MKLITILFSIMFLLLLNPIWACIWDYDTLKMERQRFPNTLELITGKFLRHSKVYYKWRVKDRLERLNKEPEKLALFDDLAVAYDKLGRHELAIQTMQKKDNLKPNMYETKANLGTFYIHAGELEKGLKLIEEAIQINPNAHFGREIYQKYLVSYILENQIDGTTILPLKNKDNSKNKRRARYKGFGFVNYLRISMYGKNSKTRVPKEEIKKAIKGILGMMKFGNFESPILLEVLGDLLNFTYSTDDASRLAARAYLKASFAIKSGHSKTIQTKYLAADAYLELAQRSLGMQKSLTFNQLQSKFMDELKEADDWFLQIQNDEKKWAQEGKNLDHEFNIKYYKTPNISTSFFDYEYWKMHLSTVILCSLLGVLILALFLLLYFRKIKFRLY